MLNSEKLKSEIDKIPKEYYGVIYEMLKSIENKEKYKKLSLLKKNDENKKKWLKFISQTYGSFSSSPIERGVQGSYEMREEIL